MNIMDRNRRATSCVRRLAGCLALYTGAAISVTATVCTPAAFAQFGASLTGTVTDNSGAVIPNAIATLTNQDTRQTVTSTSSGSGTYTFPSLPGGRYDLVVTVNGFQSSTAKAIVLADGQPRNFDVKLTPGGSNETVTVNAEDTPVLQTSDASVNATIDGAQLEKVPTYGRDPFNLIRTAPGITGDSARSGSGAAVFLPNSVGPGGSNFGVGATENTVQISAAGQRITDNNFLVDGVSVNSLGYGGAVVITPNIEAIGSIQVTSASYSAEDGRNSGAQTKVTTKSGTNQIHGSALFQYDEPGLNAYNKYAGPTPGALPVRVSVKTRDYAASLGGPIIKDKLFAFGSFEGVNQKLDSFPNAFIETPQFRAAIHAQHPGSIADQVANAPGGVPVVRNVLTQSCTNPVNQTGGTGSPLCQVVPGGLDIGSPVAKTAANGGYASFNVPNQIQYGSGLDGIPDIQYVQLDASQLSTARQYNARVDYLLTPKDQLAASIYVTKLYRVTPSDTARPNSAVPFDPTNIAATFVYIRNLGPTLLNEFRSNYTLFSENGVKDIQGAGVDFGLPYLELQNSNYTANNRIHFGAVAAPTTPGIFAENQIEFRDTVTKIFGSHTLKIGMEARWEQNNNNLVGGSRPTYTFAGLWNFFNDAPIYEGIAANPATGGEAIVNRYLHDHYIAGFVQHDWKATPNLTLNMGLRYEFFEPLYNKGLEINYPSLTPSGVLVGTTLSPRNNFYNDNYKNVGPKVGFAYAPASLAGKFVVRGGFAMAYNRLDDVLFDPALEDGPGVFSYGICCGTAPQDFGSPFLGGQIVYQRGSSKAYNSFAANPALKTSIDANGLPTSGLQIEGYGALPRLPQPYSFLYSFEVQRSIGNGAIISLGYQGSTGRHYSRLVNQNFVGDNTKSPFYALYIAHDDSNLYYNALNVHGTKQYRHGVSFEGTYTWSKAEDQVSSGDGADGNANQTFPQDNSTELGPGDFDVKHRFVGLGTYSADFYHGGNTLTKAALNGWQLNGVFTAHTGFPYTPATFAVNGLQTSANTSTISPVRPTSFVGSRSTSCDATQFKNGTSVNGVFGLGYVNGAGQNVDANGNVVTGYRPGIGRNSFRGPCYEQVDAGLAKEVHFKLFGDENALFRFQAQAFNVFNKLNLSPFTFNTPSTQIDNGATITGCPAGAAKSQVCPRYETLTPGQGTFQKAPSASAGRVIEFNARISF